MNFARNKIKLQFYYKIRILIGSSKYQCYLKEYLKIILTFSLKGKYYIYYYNYFNLMSDIGKNK